MKGEKRDLGGEMVGNDGMEGERIQVLTRRWGKKFTRRLRVRISLDGCCCGFFSFPNSNGGDHVMIRA